MFDLCCNNATQTVTCETPEPAECCADHAAHLQTGLRNRGFEVIRLNTYDTQPVSHVEESLLQQACHATVVAFASPSAVK